MRFDAAMGSKLCALCTKNSFLFNFELVHFEEFNSVRRHHSVIYLALNTRVCSVGDLSLVDFFSKLEMLA